MNSQPAMIGVDWGTSSLRACLIDSHGAVLERRGTPSGIMAVKNGAFAQSLLEVIGDWPQSAQLPIVMSGMIGSRQGWKEAAYVPCPAGQNELAGALCALDAGGLGAIRIVPGICANRGSWPDVMRGEETQIIGALADRPAKDGHFVLPGTHSKWIAVANGRIEDFTTYMTGEIFAALRDHTILGRTMQTSHLGEDRDAALPGFEAGLGAAADLDGLGALLSRLFSVRTLTLFERLTAAESEGFLSGLLIGAEILSAKPQGAVTIIASDRLTKAYAAALRHYGVEAAIASENCAAMGQFILARTAGLIA